MVCDTAISTTYDTVPAKKVQPEAGSLGSERPQRVFQEVRGRPVPVPLAAEGLPPRGRRLQEPGRDRKSCEKIIFGLWYFVLWRVGLLSTFVCSLALLPSRFVVYTKEINDVCRTDTIYFAPCLLPTVVSWLALLSSRFAVYTKELNALYRINTVSVAA